MAVGDYLIRRNASDDTTTISTSNSDLSWDTEVKAYGTDVTYSTGTFTLVTAGVYLVIWNEHFYTSDTTSNTRVNIQGELIVGGSAVEEGKCSGYIRKSSGQQQIILKGTGILRTSSGNTTLKTRVYRDDNATDTGVTRQIGKTGVQIIRLDETDNFGRYNSTSGQTLTADTATDVVLGNNAEEDSPFTRTGNAIDISTTGRYLVSYSCDLNQTNTGRTEIMMWLELQGTEVPGSRHQCYMRGSESNQDGGISHLTLVDVGTANDDLVWRVARVEGGTVTTVGSGACIQIWQLPSGNTSAIMEATTGDWNVVGNFTWDTLPHIDTADFTATAGNANIDTDDTVATFLVLGNFGRTTYTAANRATPNVGINTGGAEIPYGQDSSYVRGSGTAGFGGCGAACIIPDFGSGSIYVETIERFSSSGNSVVCQSGQFAVISLESIFTYTYPPVITDVEDEQLDPVETGVVLDGANFEATQGTGKLELGDDSDYASATKVSQSIDTWADDEIVFDVTMGALAEGPLWLFVTNDSAERSAGYEVNVGWSPYDPATTTGADHWWTFENTWNDSVGSNNWGVITRGTPALVSKSDLCRGATYAAQMNDGDDGTETPQSSYMNLGTHAYRHVGGWVEVDSYQLLPAAIYEEGGGVNNLYFILGFGNILLCNAADSSNNWKCQTFSDRPLIPNRPYHIILHMEASGGDGTIRMWVDGVKQSSYVGTITSATMAAHSGDISIGEPGSTLDTGGTDIAYKSVDTVLYSNWGSWSNTGGGAPLTTTEIRDSLFRDGAPAKYVLTAGTEAAMQTAIEAYDEDDHPDWPCTYRIPYSTSGDFELTITDQTFHENCELHLVYTGGDTLTIRNSGTSNLDSAKCYAPVGGTVTIIETAPITITVKDITTQTVIQGARVFLEAGSGGPMSQGTDIINDVTDASGQVTTEIDYTSNQPVVGRVRKGSTSTFYQTSSIVGTVTSAGFDITIFLIRDE